MMGVIEWCLYCKVRAQKKMKFVFAFKNVLKTLLSSLQFSRSVMSNHFFSADLYIVRMDGSLLIHVSISFELENKAELRQ